MSSTIPLHLSAHLLVYRFAILCAVHINEIDNNDSTHVTKTQLTCYFFRCQKVYLQGIGLLIFRSIRSVARVDIYDVHSFGMLNDQISSLGHAYRTTECTFDLTIHTSKLKQWHLSIVMFNHFGCTWLDFI